MHISDYMAQHKLKDREFAEKIGRSRASVSRYRRGKERPNWDVLERILIATDGEVTPNDWLGRL